MKSFIDFHTHILPGIDDGSNSVEESLAMIRAEIAHGVDTVFLTPHFYAQNQYPQQFLDLRLQAMEQLQSVIMDEEVIPDFVLGAEVMYYHGMSSWEALPQLALGNTRYILVELPGNGLSESVFDELESIYTDRGMIPIIAHIERYFQPLTTRKLLDRLDKLPVLLQMNGNYILDRHTRKHALNLLKQGRVHLIGSDCHGLHWRKPCLDQVVKVINDQLDDSTIQNLFLIGNKVLRGELLM